MVQRRVSWPRRAGAVCAAAGGLLLVAALFVPFTDHGTGSAESSHELADYALSGTLRPFVQPWLGALWYLTGFVGCALVATCPIAGRTVAAIRFVLAGLATAVAIVVAGQLDSAGPATRASIAAWVLAVIATVVHVITAPEPKRTLASDQPATTGLDAAAPELEAVATRVDAATTPALRHRAVRAGT